MVLYRATSFNRSEGTIKKEIYMGERGSKKDKNKADKQKQEQIEKKKKEQNAKLPPKKPA
jgi:hypothetical protein